MTSDDGQKVLMAKIGAAHGIRGEVRVKPFGDDPLSFADYGVLTSKDGATSFEVERARVPTSIPCPQITVGRVWSPSGGLSARGFL